MLTQRLTRPKKDQRRIGHASADEQLGIREQAIDRARTDVLRRSLALPEVTEKFDGSRIEILDADFRADLGREVRTSLQMDAAKLFIRHRKECIPSSHQERTVAMPCSSGQACRHLHNQDPPSVMVVLLYGNPVPQFFVEARFSPSGLLECAGTDNPTRPLIGNTKYNGAAPFVGKGDAVFSKILELKASGCRLELDPASLGTFQQSLELRIAHRGASARASSSAKL